jgi:hypothetical protein
MKQKALQARRALTQPRGEKITLSTPSWIFTQKQNIRFRALALRARQRDVSVSSLFFIFTPCLRKMQARTGLLT